jgi:transmembrane sensor
VIAGRGRATARQAVFNVRHDGEAVSVTCLEGDVRVEQRDTAVALVPGRQVIYGARALGDARAIDPELVSAWRKGLLVFRDKPLGQVIDELNRYRHGRILLINSALRRLPVNGVFHLDRLDGVIEQIHALGAQITNLPGGIILLS